MFQQVLTACVLVIGIIVFGMMIFFPRLSYVIKDKKLCRYIQYIFFVLYIIGNLFFTLLSRNVMPASVAELELFSAYRDAFALDYGVFGTLKQIVSEGFLKGMSGVHLITTEPLEGVVLNIFLYIPMGYLLPSVWPELRKGRFMWRVLFIGFFASLMTETIQLIFRLGWFDLDDLLNNTLGTIFGMWSCIKIQRKIKGDI